MRPEYYSPIADYDKRYGLLRVLNVAPMGTGKLHCRCDCGRLVVVRRAALVDGSVRCCAWRNHPDMPRPRRKGEVLVRFDGADVTLRIACEALGIDYTAARRRWGVGDDPLTVPPRKPSGRKLAAAPTGLRDRCRESGIPYGTALSRIADGWTEGEAVWIPRGIGERRDDSERDDMAPDWATYYAQG